MDYPIISHVDGGGGAHWADSAAAAAHRDGIHEVGGPKRLSQHDPLQPVPQMKKIFKIKKAVSTKILDPLPTYDNLIRNGGKQIFRIQKMPKWWVTKVT